MQRCKWQIWYGGAEYSGEQSHAQLTQVWASLAVATGAAGVVAALPANRASPRAVRWQWPRLCHLMEAATMVLVATARSHARHASHPPGISFSLPSSNYSKYARHSLRHVCRCGDTGRAMSLGYLGKCSLSNHKFPTISPSLASSCAASTRVSGNSAADALYAPAKTSDSPAVVQSVLYYIFYILYISVNVCLYVAILLS